MGNVIWGGGGGGGGKTTALLSGCLAIYIRDRQERKLQLCCHGCLAHNLSLIISKILNRLRVLK